MWDVVSVIEEDLGQLSVVLVQSFLGANLHRHLSCDDSDHVGQENKSLLFGDLGCFCNLKRNVLLQRRHDLLQSLRSWANEYQIGQHFPNQTDYRVPHGSIQKCSVKSQESKLNMKASYLRQQEIIP